MIYPINIFSRDPASNSIRPFIAFIAKKPVISFQAGAPWQNTFHSAIPVGGFVLPMPDGGLVDTVSHSYSDVNPIMSKIAEAIPGSDIISMATGMTLDPLMTQIYKGTAPRKWSGTWQIVPQSFAESLAVSIMLGFIKYWVAPDKTDTGQLGMLIQPMFFKMYFSNPIIHLAMNFNDMVMESYSINYFAQGYASTYKDMMPKHIELTMNFAEFGIKYRSDWSIF